MYSMGSMRTEYEGWHVPMRQAQPLRPMHCSRVAPSPQREYKLWYLTDTDIPHKPSTAKLLEDTIQPLKGISRHLAVAYLKCARLEVIVAAHSCKANRV